LVATQTLRPLAGKSAMLDNLSDALFDPDGTTWVALGKIVSDLD
jgi:hypothetical protein